MREIPRKNYIILALVVLLTVLLVFYMRNWYVMTREYNSDNSPMLKVISEINPDEISNYVMENPKFILYTSSGLNKDIKGFESKFKNYVLDKNIKDYMIYINTADIDVNVLGDILRGYSSNDDIINPGNGVSMYVFDSGKIVRVISEANKLDNKTIEKIFKGYGLLDA